MERMNIHDYLSQYSGKCVYFYANPGNAGDSAIAAATWQLFDRHQIDVRSFDPGKHSNLTGQIVMYGGGGNLVPAYRAASDFLRRYHDVAEKLVLLPHTIVGHRELLRDLGPNVDIICREILSYENVIGSGTRANVLLMDDLAISLDIARLREEALSPYRMIVDSSSREDNRDGLKVASRYARGLKSRVKLYGRSVLNGDGLNPKVLNCFRMDKEASGRAIPKDNVDVSVLLSYGTQSRRLAMFSAREFVSFIDLFSEVRTDRLHVAIIAALLRKQVHLYGNNYFKIRAVYEMSLRDAFPNVIWMQS